MTSAFLWLYISLGEMVSQARYSDVLGIQ